MKLVLSKRTGKLIGLAVAVCLLFIALVNVAGYFFNWKYVSVAAAAAQADKYEVRSGLLMEAMDQVGVCTPEAAAQVWANGLKSRNAALQYAVMGPQLKKRLEQELDENYPNWVTGVSSPWIQSFRITEKAQTGEQQDTIRLLFSTATSSGPAGEYHAALTVNRQGDFWQVTKISADPGLEAYMGFNPSGAE